MAATASAMVPVPMPLLSTVTVLVPLGPAMVIVPAPKEANVSAHVVPVGLITECAEASCVTVKLRLPGSALDPEVAVTVEEELDALVVVQAVGWVRASAAVRSASKRVLTARYAAASDCVAASWVLSRVCGFASTCINWLMIVPVSIPEIRPVLKLMPAMSVPQLSGWFVGRSAGCYLAGSAQQLQDALRRLVGLGEHRGAGLGQDL